MALTAVHPEGALPPPVPLSFGVRKGSVLQVSGQVAMNPNTGAVVGDTVAEQTRQVMRNVLAVLAAGGGTMADVVMLRAYLTDVDHFAEFNQAYAEFLTEPKPARTTVYVGLPPGLLVEVDALAVLDG